MRKLFALCMAMLVTIGMMAADLRIYASRLNVSVTDNVATLSYVLNENATALELQLLNATTDAVEATIAITDPTALTKGAHNAVLVNLNGQTAGTYKWALKATADAITEVKKVFDTNDPSYVYYGPRGVLVDNNPANATFGNIYVSNAYAGVSTENPGSVNTTLGIYMLNAACEMQNTNHTGYDGGVSWSGASSSPYRIALDEDGYLFVCNNDNTDGNVYMMDPANPTANFTPVLDTAGYQTKYKKSNSLVATGSGVNRKIYVVDWTDAIVRFDIGATLPSAVAPDTVLHSLAAANVANGQNSIAMDPFGGFFVAQNRSQLDTYPMLAHFANDSCDFRISSTANSALAPSTCERGAMALNADGSILILGGGRTINLYNVTYDATTHIPSLTKSDLAFGNIAKNIDGLCFDVVGNVYMVTASIEQMHIYGLPTDNNTFTTPGNSMVTVEEVQVAFYDESIIFTDDASAGSLNNASFAGESGDWAFTITDGKSKVSVDANTAYFNTPSGIKAYTKRLKTGAKSSSDNHFTMTIPTAGFLTIAYRTGSNSATDRNVVVKMGDSTLYDQIALESNAVSVLYEDNKTKVYPVAVIPVTAGTAEITYPVGSINFYAFGYSTVEPVIEALTPYVDVTNISMSDQEVTVEEDQSVTLTATVTPDNASKPQVTWSVRDDSIASVANGVVSAHLAGETYVYATADGKKDSCHVIVTPKPIFEPNIYASGIKGSYNEGVLSIEYVLNAHATKVTLLATAEETTTEFDLSGLAIGKNEASVDVSALPAGTYTWAIKAEAALVAEDEPVLANNVATIDFSSPRGLAIDNNPNNPTFGNVYVANGGAVIETSGIYVFDALLNSNNTLYTSPLWTASKASPMRITVAEEGLLYISDWSDNTPNIHIVDPATPDQETLVFGGSTAGDGIYTNAEGVAIHGSMSSCYVIGSGAERQLFTFDEDMKVGEQVHTMGLYRYDIGDLTSVWESAPSAVVYDNADNYEQNGNSVILPDNNGGWWISQDRATDGSAIPALIHVNATGAVDYNSNGALGGRTRGALAISPDQTLLASASDNSLRIWAIEWNDGVPSLTIDQSMTTTFGAQNSSSCYNIAFDYANNVYASADNKNVHVWAIVKEENATTTPAPAACAFTIEAEEEEVGVENVQAEQQVMKVVENGHVYIIRNGVKYSVVGAVVK